MFRLFRKKRLTQISPSEAIDEIVSRYIAPQLKDEGFKKAGRTWVKEFTDYSFIINVQASRWNGKDTGASFVINYGVYVPVIYSLLYGMQLPKSPKEYDCVLSKRLSESKKGEIWWEIYDHTDTAKLGQKLNAKIFEQCIAQFNQINSISDVARKSHGSGWGAWGPLASALLYAEIGDREKAEGYFISAYRGSSENKPYQSKVLSVAKSCGFNLSL